MACADDCSGCSECLFVEFPPDMPEELQLLLRDALVNGFKVYTAYVDDAHRLRAWRRRLKIPVGSAIGVIVAGAVVGSLPLIRSALVIQLCLIVMMTILLSRIRRLEAKASEWLPPAIMGRLRAEILRRGERPSDAA